MTSLELAARLGITIHTQGASCSGNDEAAFILNVRQTDGLMGACSVWRSRHCKPGYNFQNGMSYGSDYEEVIDWKDGEFMREAGR